MQLYKALSPIQVLSFDLDDTLYDNAPVLRAAEQAMLQSLQQQLKPELQRPLDYWSQLRWQLGQQQPDIRHDIGRWRLLGIEAGLIQLGLADCEAGEIADLAYHAFWQARSRIQIQPEVRQLLEQLAGRYQLIAITNGNACIQRMGLGDLFEFSLQAGPDGRMKPFPDLFLAAAKRLQLSPQRILHIGDSHRADVMGALNAGCQAAWLDHHQSCVSVLPHIRLTKLSQLASLQG
ncbi:HAD-IA family hydrolase [Alkalimonas amylolytica]|uniref:Putative hydrolase of the HAD superfamily n=1 Tax=Alkalimonas amylolytica TaxID=152573 RepID=A0A1H4EGT9_ALKAM|nr:HAD-IA family hydrolase [Alkalimonas amylolytica]SEA83938.1 putative hydrolase of the HAD superfamily [Alkalimonas amylolytica]